MTNSAHIPDNTEKVSVSPAGGSEESQTRKKFGVWKILLPVVIGVSVVAYMFWRDAEKENLSEVLAGIHLDFRTVLCIILAFLCMFGRDFGLSWRFRALTDHNLRWGSAFKVDFLCEFTSCVTPSAVGGSSLGMVFLSSQGIEFGRATTLMMTTLFLDELFFVLACPLVILLTPGEAIFSSGDPSFSDGIRTTFWIVYFFLFLWTLILFIGIILNPNWMKSMLVLVCRLRFLRKFQGKATELGDNMIATSRELKSRKFRFWIEVFGGTVLSWLSRFMVVNALFWGFISGSDPYQWIILAREFVIWVVLMVSPTPGGSGLSEWLFSEYYGDLVCGTGMALVLAVFWRIVSYYVYLFIGASILPGWIHQTYNKFHSGFRGRAEK